MSIFSALISPITSMFEKRAESKHAEIIKDAEMQQEVIQSRAEDEKRNDELQLEEVKGANEYDLQVLKLRDQKWTDDVAFIVTVFPFVFCFIPFMAIYVSAGWDALAKSPVWYQMMLPAIITGELGMRWFWRVKK